MPHPNPLQARTVAIAIVCVIQAGMLYAWIIGAIDWPWYTVTLPTWGAFGVIIATHAILAIDEFVAYLLGGND